MSESIWSREIEEGLKNFFNSFLKYIDEEGEEQPISVKIRKPEGDFNEESYPVIYLQNEQQKLSTVRYDPTKTIISRNEENNTVIVEDAPLPFECVYQIDFYSLYQSELNEMLQKFLAYTHGGRYFNLPVKDQSGHNWNLLVMRRGGTMTRRDYIGKDTASFQGYTQGDARLFHGLFYITVHTQLNENIREEKYYVTNKEVVNTGNND